jgi:hypothetical protein
VAALAGCDGERRDAEAGAGASVGAACGPSVACEAALICVDGTCRARPGFPDAQLGPPSVVPVLPDGLWDDVPVPDVGAVDGSDGADDAAAQEVEDGAPSDTAQTSDDGGPDGDAGPIGDPIVLVIGEDEADMSPGGTSLSLDPGQGWVTELTVPFSGGIVGVQALLLNAFGPDSCGQFFVGIWLPDGDGDFADAPSWTSPDPLALVGGPKPLVFFIPAKVPSKAGRIRLGLIFQGPCSSGGPAPVMGSDDSGDLSRTWLWAPDALGSPWIDGEILGIEGRWGLSVLIEVVL